MAGPALPTDVDATYADDAEKPSQKTHQQFHDKIHKAVNEFDQDVVRQAGHLMGYKNGLFQPINLEEARTAVGADRLFGTDPTGAVEGIPKDTFRPVAGMLWPVPSPSGDATGATDRAAINDAYAQMATAPWNVAGIHFRDAPTGDPYIVDQEIVPPNNSRTEGLGMGRTVVKAADGTQIDVCGANNPQGVELVGFTVDGNKSGTTSAGAGTNQNGVHLTASTSVGIDATLRRIEARNCHQSGVRVRPDTDGWPARVDADHLNCHHNNGSGLYAIRTTQLTVDGGSYDDNGAADDTQGIVVDQGSGAQVNHPRCRRNARHGLVFVRHTDFEVNGGIYSNNDPDASAIASYGITVSVACQRFAIDSPYCKDNGYGGITIDVEEAANSTVFAVDATITGAVCIGGAAATTHGIVIRFARFLTVTGCTIEGVNDGIQCGGAWNTIADNTVRNANDAVVVIANTGAAQSGNHRLGPTTASALTGQKYNFVSGLVGVKVYDPVEATAEDGDTTPSVLGVKFLQLANTAPTTITTLDDGTTGDEVVIWSLNGNSTIQDGSFQLQGNADWTMTGNDTLHVVNRQGVWMEVSRSAN